MTGKKVKLFFWAFLFFAPRILLAQNQNGTADCGWGFMSPMTFGGFGFLGVVLSLAFWIMIILGLAYLIKYVIREGKNQEKEDAINVLRGRYAKGEISKEEFDEIRSHLLGG